LTRNTPKCRICAATPLRRCRSNLKGQMCTRKHYTECFGHVVHHLTFVPLYPAHRPSQPYGRIEDITRPQPAPAGTLRSSIVRFERVRSAVRAQNCMHGFTAPGAGASTRLSVVYEQAMKGRVIRDWLSNHPRIVLPIVAFLLGTLTYAVWVRFGGQQQYL